ncbi:MAG: YdbC family protein [Oscillospiraceae bacterium]|nr:YdbC family protein [Oscillospiraceae bacterium]
MAEFSFEIVEELGVLSETAKGWTKELNRVSWNGREPKYDIREWAPEHEKMGKGVTLSTEEMTELVRLLGKVELPEGPEEPDEQEV